MLLKFSNVEQAIYDRTQSETQKRQICCHLQISENMQNIAGTEQQTLQQVKEAMINHTRQVHTICVLCTGCRYDLFLKITFCISYCWRQSYNIASLLSHQETFYHIKICLFYYRLSMTVMKKSVTLNLKLPKRDGDWLTKLHHLKSKKLVRKYNSYKINQIKCQNCHILLQKNFQQCYHIVFFNSIV